MAYVATNPPVCIVPAVGTHSATWLYKSADVHTDVDASEYFANGKALGMKVNDLVIVIKTTATIGATLHVVTTVATAGVTIAPAILA